MKKVLVVLSIIALGFLASSCGTQREKSGNLHEKAIIVSMIYSPSIHETHLASTAMKVGGKHGGLGVDYNGNEGMRIGKHMQITSTTVPEQFGVVFQCQHGTFTIQGPGIVNDNTISKHKILYDKLNGHIRDTVDVIYQEIYDVTYDKDKTTGKQVETSRVLVDMDFIDAQLLK